MPNSGVCQLQRATVVFATKNHRRSGKKLTMSSGQAPSLMIDLAATTIADRQRSARDRDQRVVARRTRRDAARAR
jgi:hypothetical protein